MASVSVDDVRDVINVTSEEIPDEKIAKMIKRAQVTLELETDKQVDNNDCSDTEKESQAQNNHSQANNNTKP